MVSALFMNLSSGSPFLPATTSQPPTIGLDYAKYKGVSLNNGVDQYLGMRFARAPVGDLRFRAPQDPEHYSEVQSATEVILILICGAPGSKTIPWIDI